VRTVLPTPMGSGDVGSSLFTLSSQRGLFRASPTNAKDLIGGTGDLDWGFLSEHGSPSVSKESEHNRHPAGGQICNPTTLVHGGMCAA